MYAGLRYLALIWVTGLLAIGQTASSQQPFYYFGDTKIALAPAADVRVVQELTPGVVNKSNLRAALTSELGSGRFMASESAGGEILHQLDNLARRNLVQANPAYRVGDAKLAVTGDIIVTFKPSVSSSEANRILRLFGTNILSRPLEPNSYRLHISTAVSTLSVANTLHQRSDVVYAQPDFLHVVEEPKASKRPALAVATASPVFPSDEYFPQQWSLENRNTNPARGKLGADIKIKEAWKVVPSAGDVIIAIIDNGIDATHPDLKNRVIKALDTFDDGRGIPEPEDNHGTNCAGVLAAITNNGIGVAGVAGDAKLVSVRVMRTRDGISEYSSDTLARGLKMATDAGASVISMSLVLSQPETAILEQIKMALTGGPRGALGTIMVFPTGNAGNDTVSFPANMSTTLPVIAVGATNEYDEVKTRASRDGDTSWGSNTGKEVTVVAPGVNICTTDPMTAGQTPYVCDFRGTSAAVPLVAGVAALILARSPQLTATQVRDRLTSTADKLGPALFDVSYGWGRINACKAINGANCD